MNIKKILLLNTLLFTLCSLIPLISGCRPSSQKEAFYVVDKYLEASAKRQMSDVLPLLAGEALLETKANMSLVTESQQITNKKKRYKEITENLAEVTVDYTVSTEEFNNRKAYLFKLKKSNKQWKIYKIENTNYLYNKLKSKAVPTNAKLAAKEYIELSKTEKDKQNIKYLTGELLNASMAAQTLPSNIKPNIKETVIDIKCLGASHDYAILEVHSLVNRNGNKYSVETILHIAAVNEHWKIAKMDIADIKEGTDN